MNSILRFVGRLVFVTVLLTSAVLKIKQPASHVTEITEGYNTLRGLHPVLTDVIPPITTVSSQLPMPTAVRVIGAIEALTALLIVFGDRLGGVLLFVYLLVCGAVRYLPTIITAVTKNKLNDLQALLPQLALFVSLVGFSLVFMSQVTKKKAAMKV